MFWTKWYSKVKCTHRSHSCVPPSHQHRYTGTRWFYQCKYRRYGRDYFHSRWCLRVKSERTDVEKSGRHWIKQQQRTLGYESGLLSWQYVPVNPSWHSQLKCPPAWLRQRPWGPQTLEEMNRMPPGVLLDATATVQLSITAGKTWGLSHQ